MCKEGTPEMEAIVSVLERAGRYLSLIRPMDVLDVAIIAYLVYKILCLVRSTRAENILKGVAIFLVALWLSSPAALNLRGVNYILSHMVEWGVLALIILFQPVDSQIPNIMERIFMQYYRKAKSTNFLPTYKYLSMAENNMDTNQK